MATVLCVFVSVIGITVCSESGRLRYGLLAGGSICFLLLLNAGLFYMQYADISITTKMYASMSGVESINNVYGGEYLLEGTETSLCVRRDIMTEDDTVQADGYVSHGGVVSFACKNTGSEPKHVAIPLFCYDNYQAYDQQGGEQLSTAAGQNNRIVVEVPGGYDGTIEVRYVIPVPWKIAYVVSALAGIGFAGICVVRGKDRRLVNEEKND